MAELNKHPGRVPRRNAGVILDRHAIDDRARAPQLAPAARWAHPLFFVSFSPLGFNQKLASTGKIVHFMESGAVSHLVWTRIALGHPVLPCACERSRPCLRRTRWPRLRRGPTTARSFCGRPKHKHLCDKAFALAQKKIEARPQCDFGPTLRSWQRVTIPDTVRRSS